MLPIRWLSIYLVILLFIFVRSVDRSAFKTCDEVSFCRRHRKSRSTIPSYIARSETLNENDSSITIILENVLHKRKLLLSLSSYEDSRMGITIDEVDPLRKRFKARDALAKEPVKKGFVDTWQDQSAIHLKTADNQEAVININPFRIDILDKTDLVFTLNSQALLKYEHFRPKTESNVMAKEAGLQPVKDDDDELDKEDGELPLSASGEKSTDSPNPPSSTTEKTDLPEGTPAGGEKLEKDATPPSEDEGGFWEEHWKSHYDSKPHGSSSVGLDISLVGFKHIYGLPEHADSFALKSTTHSEPYRLFNLDVFEYETYNPMALYGSIPFIVGHNVERTVGILWLNPSETWVDVKSSFADKGLFRSLLDKFKSEPEIPQIDTHWISETGLIDIYLFFGPSPTDIFRQYTDLTGTMPLPPYFSLGYHQCRWNYNDMEDVEQVNDNFDRHEIPYDALWLDIEHTDGKRYFTWDPLKFSDPKKMIGNLESKGRKLVTIVDPHIKKDDNYFIYGEANKLDYFVKDRDNKVYEGWCWPGASMYLDFLNPVVRDWWASKYGFDQYNATSHNVHIWNDMNEPSVFNGPEVTMYKDCKHYGGWEHREIHNIYGLYSHMATYEGLLKRTDGQKRPFILTRSFFVGSQRYAAVWTGDNTADWSHLRISFAMMLSLSVSGIPFVGADVGGFFKNPEPELLVRWYQAGAFNPFYRAHAHIDTKRREPWLLSDKDVNAVQNAIILRYQMLPYWYTIFYEHSVTGLPVLRPVWMEFPADGNTFDEELAAMIGSGLLVRPVVDQGVSTTSVYLPGENSVWYDWDTFLGLNGPGATTIQTSVISKIPIFIRGGAIIPLKLRQRRASKLTEFDPYTLYVALDKTGRFANGTIFFDDLETFNYQKGQYCYRALEYIGNEVSGSLSSRLLSGNLCAKGMAVERIVIMGLKYKPVRISSGSGEQIHFAFDPARKVAVLRKPIANIGVDWTINLTSF